jgi:hypothetical protein
MEKLRAASGSRAWIWPVVRSEPFAHSTRWVCGIARSRMSAITLSPIPVLESRIRARRTIASGSSRDQRDESHWHDHRCKPCERRLCRQVFELSKAPVMFSHSNVKGVFDCARNLPHDILDMVPNNGGAVCVTFVPEHVASRRKDTRMEMVLDHLFYIAERIG